MSTHWAALLPAAMVGTERQTPTLAWSGEIGAALAQISQTKSEPAVTLLRQAAVLACCELAGAQPVPSTTHAPLPCSAEAETCTQSERLLAQLDWAWHEGPARLHHEICHRLQVAGQTLASRHLPGCLELARRSIGLRPAMASVIGERGRWLATQHEPWAYAVGVSDSSSDETIWSEGSHEQRCLFLRKERLRNPQAARERLSQALKELGAKERADCVEVLQENLSLDDAELLDTLRQDRSRDVRASALALLLRLPQAEPIKRACTRMAAQLVQERVLLRKRWLIDAPTSVGTDWKDDNLDTQRPKNETLGERAWWLYQMVRQVPLPWWQTHTGMNAAELLAWAKGNDWQAALVRGWREVLLQAPQDDWCEAFLAVEWAIEYPHQSNTIFALLPRERRELIWLTRLRQADSLPLVFLAQEILTACAPGEFLPLPLSEQVARLLARRLAEQQLHNDYGLRQHLDDLCCVLHPQSLHLLSQTTAPSDATSSLTQQFQTVAQILATRNALYRP